MAELHEALPAAMRGGHAANSDALVPILVPAIRPGDVVIVKGSFGSRMSKVIDALLALDQMPHAANG